MQHGRGIDNMINLAKALQTAHKTYKIIKINDLNGLLLTVTSNELPSLYRLFSGELLDSDVAYKETDARITITLLDNPERQFFEIFSNGESIKLSNDFILSHNLREEEKLKDYCDIEGFEVIISDKTVLLYDSNNFRRI